MAASLTENEIWQLKRIAEQYSELMQLAGSMADISSSAAMPTITTADMHDAPDVALNGTDRLLIELAKRAGLLVPDGVYMFTIDTLARYIANSPELADKIKDGIDTGTGTNVTRPFARPDFVSSDLYFPTFYTLGVDWLHIEHGLGARPYMLDLICKCNIAQTFTDETYPDHTVTFMPGDTFSIPFGENGNLLWADATHIHVHIDHATAPVIWMEEVVVEPGASEYVRRFGKKIYSGDVIGGTFTWSAIVRAWK